MEIWWQLFQTFCSDELQQNCQIGIYNDLLNFFSDCVSSIKSLEAWLKLRLQICSLQFRKELLHKVIGNWFKLSPTLHDANNNKCTINVPRNISDLREGNYFKLLFIWHFTRNWLQIVANIWNNRANYSSELSKVTIIHNLTIWRWQLKANTENCE